MKTLRSKEALENATELAEVIALRKQCEKREKALKAWFLESLADEQTAKVGDHMIIITESQTSYIDREKMTVDQGEDFVNQYLKITHYKKVEVK